MIGYLDMPSGISGDMMLGCLLDAGWSIDALRDVIARLPVPTDKWELGAETVMKGPMRATQAIVKTPHEHAHRHLSDIRKIIDAAELDDAVKQNAIGAFTRLAEAEARVHGTTPQKIHFHEVGAVDAIIDIVGSCAGLHALGIETLYASALPMGEGWGHSEHGAIPLPAPATLELLAAGGAPTRPANGPGEWVTPTGAALVCQLATFRQPEMELETIGTGAGQKNCDWPNIARLWIGQPAAAGPMVQIDTNIDDMNPELFSPVSDKLFQLGARDVWLTPTQMKKGRPAVVLSVLAPAAAESIIAETLLRETTTLGVRVHRVHRHIARRDMRTIDTPHGSVRIKLKWIDRDLVGSTPEFEDCKHRAAEANVPVRVVYEAAMAAAHAAFMHADESTTPSHSHGPTHDHAHTGHSRDEAHGHNHAHSHGDGHTHEPAGDHSHGHTHDHDHDDAHKH